MTLTTLQRAHELIATPQIESTLMMVRKPLLVDRTCLALTKGTNVRPSRRSSTQGKSAAIVKSKKRTPETIVDTKTLRNQVLDARRTDVAIGRGERAAGIVGLAAPIRDGTGSRVAVISVGAPASRMEGQTFEDCRRLLLETTETISTELGFRQPLSSI